MAKHTVHVIGIGGTGMRCIESMIHLCAMGMYDDTEVNILALDTDIANGNFKRVKELVQNYNAVNGGVPRTDTFFSAQINYHEFSPKYSENTTFDKIAKYDLARKRAIGSDTRCRESDILDLFLTPEVRDMSLQHGYRAQTQMGSMLMYHAIIEEANRAAEGGVRSELKTFLSGLTQGTDHRAFIFGSVFGGTGASSIPILPHALNVAVRILFNEEMDILKGNRYGSVVLTNYFSFDKPNKQNEVVADSAKFAINSQAALMFYASDPTVQQVYDRLYMIGREKSEPLPKGTASETGGEKQANPADYIEMLAAFAAYDFFAECDKEKPFERAGDESKFYYMQAGDEKRLDFNNFCSEPQKFKEKFGTFVAAAMTNSRSDFLRQMANMYLRSIKENEELKPLNDFMNRFYDAAEHSGWAQELYDSTHGNGFLLNDAVFDKGIYVRKKKYNKDFFCGDNPESFSASSLFGDAIFDKVKNTFAKETDASKDETIAHLMERTYAALHKLYFNN